MKRLAIITSHPIQYNAPWFSQLAGDETIVLKVFYTWEQSQEGAKHDPGFGKKIEWDIPLLEGYDYVFVKNTSPDPGTHHFKGIINPTLNEEVSAWKPDVLLVFGWSFSSHLSCMRFFHGRLPVLFRGDSTLLDESPGIKTWLRRIFLRWVYRFIDYALYVGENNKKYFLAHGVREEQLIHLPHAIDNQRFAQPQESYEEKAADWRKTNGLLATDLVVLFAGKLESKKDPFFLLELAEAVKREDVKFLLVGNGQLETSLKERAGTNRSVAFAGFQNQQMMPVIYRTGDVFILPSRGPGETWGLAVNEAMACSRPVMVSEKTGGAPDLVREGENGIVFKNGDLSRCIQFINRLADDRNLQRQMGQQSGRIIEEFSFKTNSKILIELVTNRI